MNKHSVFFKTSLCTALLFTQAYAACKMLTDDLAAEKQAPATPIMTEESTLGFGFNCITDEQFRDEVKYLEDKNSINKINLAYQFYITDKTLEYIAKEFPALASIILIECDKITNNGVQALLKNCSNLRLINLDECPQINAIGIENIVSDCPYLETLSLYRCKDIDDDAIVNIISRCKFLQFLDLGMNNKITDVGLLSLADNCPLLKELCLEFCNRLTDKGIKTFCAKRPGCKVTLLAGL